MPQDFSGQNLRGRSFKGQNLEGANFSGADIRSADFTNANLKGANFSHSKAGLQRRWAVGLIIVSLLLASLSGLISAIAGVIAGSALTSGAISNTVAGIVTLITIASFFIAIIRQNLETTLGTVAVVVVIAIGLGITIGRVMAGVGFASGVGAGARDLAVTTGLALAGAGTVAVAVIGTGAVVVAEATVWAWVIGGAVVGIGAMTWATALAVGVVFARALHLIGNRQAHLALDLYVAIAVVVLGALLGSYIAWQALIRDKKFTQIRGIAVAFSALAGTSFRDTNLTDANFSQAILKNTDFRGSHMTRTCWFDAKKLDLARVGKTYLEKPFIRQLLVMRQGQDKNFDGLNLRGVNLCGATLMDASFVGTDLSDANLQDANLSRAKLKQAQLDGTDFTGATLTGAYIEDWGITNTTKFDGVKCEYVYMRLPTKENPDPLRKPDNREEVFADGEFGDFIKPIVDTLDLYHNQGVDPRAIAISFKQLAENHPDAELEIVAMERRGEDKFLLRAKTATTADKSELSAEYFNTYNRTKSLPEQDIKLLLIEKDRRIASLETMVITALERPSFYAQTYQNQGDTMGSDRTINMGDGNYNERIEGNYVQGNYYAGGEQQSLAQAAREIQQLLEQLEQSHPSNTTVGKMAIATEAIQRIESDRTLAERVLSALKAGGTEALAQFLNHPAASFVIGALEDWQNTRGS